MSERIINGIEVGSMFRQNAELQAWRAAPSLYESKNTITRQELINIEHVLVDTYRGRVIESGLAHSTGRITQNDLELAHEICDAVSPIESEIINDPKREPWNASVTEHVRQVEAFTWAITRRVNKADPELNLDVNRMRAKAAFHDLGRSVTHHATLHGLAGHHMLDELGFGADFKTTTLFHLEAGVGPYIAGITPENWQDISNTPGKIDEIVAKAPIAEVIISVADIGKKGIQQKDGSFVNTIADPVEGLVPSAKRRLKTEKGEPSDKILMDLASDDSAIREAAMMTLSELGAKPEDVNKMAMYFGAMSAMVRRLKNQYGVVFEGPTGVIAQAKRDYKSILAGK